MPSSSSCQPKHISPPHHAIDAIGSQVDRPRVAAPSGPGFSRHNRVRSTSIGSCPYQSAHAGLRPLRRFRNDHHQPEHAVMKGHGCYAFNPEFPRKENRSQFRLGHRWRKMHNGGAAKIYLRFGFAPASPMRGSLIFCSCGACPLLATPSSASSF